MTMNVPPQTSGDLAAYEFYIEMMLSWRCRDCETHVECTDDIRADEQEAPYGGWATRKAKEAMAQGWFVKPLTADGSLMWSVCYCPNCTIRRGLIVAKN
jgi:hypothetical protein